MVVRERFDEAAELIGLERLLKAWIPSLCAFIAEVWRVAHACKLAHVLKPCKPGQEEGGVHPRRYERWACNPHPGSPFVRMRFTAGP